MMQFKQSPHPDCRCLYIELDTVPVGVEGRVQIEVRKDLICPFHQKLIDYLLRDHEEHNLPPWPIKFTPEVESIIFNKITPLPSRINLLEL